MWQLQEALPSEKPNVGSISGRASPRIATVAKNANFLLIDGYGLYPQSRGTTLPPRPLVMADSPRSTPSPSLEEIWLRTVTPPPKENQRLIRAEEIVNRLRRVPDGTQEASETRTTPPHLKENRPHETEEGSPPCGQDWRRTT